MMKIIILSFLLIYSNLLFGFEISKSDLKKVKSKYGQRAYKRTIGLKKAILKASKSKPLLKLKYINRYLNKIKYKTDIKHWRKNDYWAAPLEFTGTGAGDCEDYAISKYFSLIRAGIPEKKLRIAYVKLIRKRTKYKETHMILLYYNKPNSTPIVLDNVDKRLKLASKRKDLKFIYSFNAGGLWQSKNKGSISQKKVGSNKLKQWKNLINKI